MLRYVLTRILLIIPTLFVVSVIAYMLSGIAARDIVEQRLSLQGLTTQETFVSSNRYQKEYENLYRKMHLDKELFYFTISPQGIPINTIVHPTERNRVSGLLKNRYREELIINYNKDLKRFISDVTHLSESTDNQTLFIKLENAAEKEEIRSYVNQIMEGIPRESQVYANDLIQSIDQLKKKTISWPHFKWNGANNQYHFWATKFITGDFGLSIRDGREASGKIWNGMKWTLTLVLLNFFLACLIAIPLGIYNGIHRDTLFDKVSNLILFSLYAIPVFWLATLLIVFFSTSEYGMKIFPSVGLWHLDTDSSLLANMIFSARQLILPVICLTLVDLAYLSRLLRGDIIKESEKPYAMAVMAKGLSKRATGYRHLLPNALTNTITLIVGSIPLSMAGTLIIEVIFNIPGMGRLMYDSIFVSDWNVVFGILMIIAFLTLIFYLLGDILYALANPKISLR